MEEIEQIARAISGAHWARLKALLEAARAAGASNVQSPDSVGPSQLGADWSAWTTHAEAALEVIKARPSKPTFTDELIAEAEG